jgi:DNA-binding protein HU-beta
MLMTFVQAQNIPIGQAACQYRVSLYNIGAAIYSTENAAVSRIRDFEWEGKTVAKAPAKKAATRVPDKLTSASLIGYLAEKNGLVRRDVKQVLEDLFEIVGAGVMRGERVALGKIGKMFIRVRPARGARTGRNPLTGQEITIPAKPATKVPRFAFSKTFKEAALKAKAKK